MNRPSTIIALLTAFSVVSYVLRTNISVAAAAMKPELGLSDVQMGQIFSAFLLGYALSQVPAGMLGDNLGPRIVLALAAVWWAATSALTAFVPGRIVTTTMGVFVALVGIRFVLGVGEAATYPVAARMIANWVPPSRYASANGLVIGGASLGSAATAPVVAWIMVNWGWRNAFYFSAMLALGLALVWWKVAQDRPSSARVDATEGAETNRAPVQAPAGGGPGLVFRSRPLLLLSIGYFFSCYVAYIFVFWLYLYLVEVRGFGLLKGGMFAALPFIASSVMTPLGGVIGDALGSRIGVRRARRRTAMTGLVVAAIALLAGANVGNPYLAIAGLALAVGSTNATESLFWSSVTDLAGPHAGAACGVLNMVGNLGGVVSTVMVPVLVSQFGWGVALGSGSMFAVVSASLWLGIDDRAPAVLTRDPGTDDRRARDCHASSRPAEQPHDA